MPDTAAPELGVEVPAEWAAPGAETAAGEPSSADRWWTRFGDPRLEELIEEALSRNGDLAAAAARIDQAAAQARIAGADVHPRLDASGNGSRQRQNFIGFPIPGSDRKVLSTTSTSLGVSLNVTWEADLWGRLRARETAALADLAALSSLCWSSMLCWRSPSSPISNR